MSRQPMSNADAGWLQMESPTNPMMIAGFFEFDQPMDFERLKATVEHRLLRFERFKQRIVKPRVALHQYYWETDPHFELDSHLHRIALPAPGDLAAFKAAANDLASTPLDLSRPLWQFHLIENYGERSVLFCRLHHCIADGIALLHVLLSLCDDTAAAPWPTAQSGNGHRPVGLAATLWRPAGSALSAAQTVAHESVDLLRNPARAVIWTQMAAGAAQSMARVTLMRPDSRSVLKGQLSVARRMAWSQPLPLDAVKAVSRATGATVNDVMVSSLAGALQRYMQGQGQDAAKVRMRAMMPVNLRPADESPEALGNRFGLYASDLPMSVADPLERLAAFKQHIDHLKHTPEGYVTRAIVEIAGMTPVEVERPLIRFFASKTSVVITNVAGPRQKLYLADNQIRQVNFWVPQTAGIGLGVSIFSYAGEVVVGVMANAKLVPDPEAIVAAFEAEFAALQARVAQPALPTETQPAISHNGHGPAAAAAGRCQALTKAGQPCKNAALPGSTNCRVHTGVVIA
ncbi:MAG TPA: wax ester/triacylglycerol synthase family O-acyltransferase [Anaerolineae bacterium]|nr:wax ester/triacylglycerol synthase family O-acyltransferase [Anaerolineae bacterium]